MIKITQLAIALVLGFLITLFASGLLETDHQLPDSSGPTNNNYSDIPPAPSKPNFGPYTISNQIPEQYFSYQEIKGILQKWNTEAPEITEIGVYGKNRQNTDLTYFRIGTKGKPKILIHAAIHGNERLSTAATLGIMGKMLHDFKRDDEVTWIIENRDVYFVPVFSPESYLRSRHIEQGDPNRNWAYPGSRTDNTSSPIVAIKEFFLREKFVGVIDGHTTGRLFLWPSLAKTNDREAISNLAKEMGSMANYDPRAISHAISGRASGFAIDWYYWKGAVAILTEFGFGSHNQPIRAIEPEVTRTYRAYLHFMKKSPEIKLEGVTGMSAMLY